MADRVRNAQPPKALLALINPVMRCVVRSPAGRMLRGVAMLEFEGRRSGRIITVVTGYYSYRGSPAIFTDATWRLNFAGGHPVTVTNRGRRTACTGTLIEDPETVADALNATLRSGTRPMAVGMKTGRDHVFTPEEAGSLRDMILLKPD